MEIKKNITNLPRWPFLGLIWLYQKTLSPDHGVTRVFFPYGYCKFYPSCSMYGYQALRRYGVVRGIPRLMYRILRCNPLSQGGIDLP